MKRRIWLSAAVLACVVLSAVGIRHSMQQEVLFSMTPERVFELSERPEFLNEELALSKARETLAAIDPRSSWKPVPSGKNSVAPDGRSDEYFVRRKDNPFQGTVLFSNGSRVRLVDVRLEGTRVACSTLVPR